MRRATTLLLTAILFFSILSPVSAVNLKLIIKDDANRHPLYGVMLTINETGKTYYLNSGESIEINPGKYHFIFKKPGYWTAVLPVEILNPTNYPSPNLTLFVLMHPITQGAFYVDYSIITPNPKNLTLNDELLMRFIVKPYSGIGEGTDNVKLHIKIEPLGDGQKNIELADVMVNGEDYPPGDVISLGNRPNGFDVILQFNTITNGTDKLTITVSGSNPTTSVVLYSGEVVVKYTPMPKYNFTQTNETAIPYNPHKEAEENLWRRLIVIAFMFIILNALYYGSKRKGY
ncbi:exported protein of unknown function (plasmid) [Thermococcus nautili]|uniref:hypothetical protein n=1 Tax=Thermococcus nautili TaxID=195522 RepID=UPI0025521A2E|nr:hypothetical protein [Thermococcus nautili]CAI1494268.1 exported protein of unknown function [Thermococcus nautili]